MHISEIHAHHTRLLTASPFFNAREEKCKRETCGRGRGARKGQSTGGGEHSATPGIFFVLGSSTKMWRHIRFKLRQAARFTKRKNVKPSSSCPFILRMERCCGTIFLRLELFRRKTTESLLSSNGGFYAFAKLVLFRLVVLIVRDSVITLSAIA